MRLEGQFKLGYYPTPVSEVDRVLSRIEPTPGAQFRVLDPCAGEGEALLLLDAKLAQNARPSAYAVELSPKRHAEISSRIFRTFGYHSPHASAVHTLQADFKNVVVSKESMSLLWLNPPYDWSDDEREETTRKKARMEYVFFRDAFPVLQKGGILVYIVPEKLLGFTYVRQVLADNLAHITAYKFAPDTYENFSQIVILGERRPYAVSEDNRAYLELLHTQGVPDFDPTARTYIVRPQTLAHGFTLRANDVPADDLTQMVIASGGAFASQQWKDFYNPIEGDFRPLVQPRTGHVATLIASGMMGVMRLPDRLIKGNTTKEIIAFDKDGHRVLPTSSAAVKLVTTFASQIHQLHLATGNLTTASKPEELEQVFTEHASELADQVISRYQPLYDGKTTPAEESALDRMIPFKKLPGMKKPGLLPLQRQLAVATARSARTYGFGILVGEMGIGKTSIALSALELLPNAYPAVVLVPSHLVPKWIRECREVNPDTNPMEIASVRDVNAFFRDYGRPEQKGIAVISKEKAKLGPGWRATRNTRPERVTVQSYDAARDVYVTRSQIQRCMSCPNCGHMVDARDMSKTRRLTCKGKVQRVVNGKWTKVTCGTPLYVFGTQVHSRKANDEETPRAGNSTNFSAAREHGKLLWGQNIARRWPISKYIKDKGFKFGTFIGDEAHKYKGKSTDQGRAFHNLAKASKYTLALTGTLFGGKASDLYFLLYRLFPRTLKAEGFKFDAETAFVNKYGRLESTLAAADEDDVKHGRTTAMQRKTLNVREIPGITPAIYRHVLPYTIFAKIDDLGVAMPSFTERIHRLDMAPDQSRQYVVATKTLLDHIKDGISSFSTEGMREAKALLSVYLQLALGRPNTGFRADSVWWKPKKDGSHEPYWVPEGYMPVLAPEAALDGKDEIGQDDGFMADGLADLDEEARAVADAPDGDEDEHAHDSTRKGKPKPKPTHADGSTFRVPPGKEHMVLQPTIFADDLLPKERWLVDLVSSEMKRGRRSIIYLRQTGTRDIQPRLQEILRCNGINAEILPDGDPRKREEWIRTHPCHALLTNAVKVETGLDLVQFQTIIFYEMTYSLFTFWQALRRVWRLGQTKAVAVHYAVYRQTVEEDALALMGQKMRAAHLLYGDTTQTAVSEEATAMDFMAELAKRILDEQRISVDGIEGLVNHERPKVDSEGAEANGEYGMSEELAAEPEELLPENMPNEDGIVTITGDYTVGDIVQPAALPDHMFKGKEDEFAEPAVQPTPQHEVAFAAKADFDAAQQIFWTARDIHSLFELLGDGRMVLVADGRLGLPTIQDIPGRYIEHMGYGCFRYRSPNLEFLWDAGGAMQKTTDGLSYTTLDVRKGAEWLHYDRDSVKRGVLRLSDTLIQTHERMQREAAAATLQPEFRTLRMYDTIRRGGDTFELVEIFNYRAWFVCTTRTQPGINFEILPSGEISDTGCRLTPYLTELAFDNPDVSITSNDEKKNAGVILTTSRSGKLPKTRPEPTTEERPIPVGMQIGDAFIFQGNKCVITAIALDGSVHAEMTLASGLFGAQLAQPIVAPIVLNLQQFQEVTGTVPAILPAAQVHKRQPDDREEMHEGNEADGGTLSTNGEQEFVRRAAAQILEIGYLESDDEDLYGFFSTAAEDKEVLEFIGERLAEDPGTLPVLDPRLFAILTGPGNNTAWTLQSDIAAEALKQLLAARSDAERILVDEVTSSTLPKGSVESDISTADADAQAAAIAELKAKEQMYIRPPQPEYKRSMRRINIGDSVRIDRHDYVFIGVSGPYVQLQEEGTPSGVSSILNLRPWELRERAEAEIPEELSRVMAKAEATPASTTTPPTSVRQDNLLRMGHIFWLGPKQYVLCSPTHSHIDNSTIAAREYNKPGSTPRKWADAETFTLSTGLYLAPDYYDSYFPQKWSKPLPQVPVRASLRQSAPAALSAPAAQAQAAIAASTKKASPSMADLYAAMGRQGRRS